MFSSLPRIWAGAGLEEKPFGYILQCAVLIRVLSSLDCLQISKETLWPAGFFTRHLCDWSSYCFFPVEILSFLEAGFQLGFGCFVNTTWNGGSKKCSCLSALFVFSAPPLLLWQVLGSGQGHGTMRRCFMPVLPWRWSTCVLHRFCRLCGTSDPLFYLIFPWKRGWRGLVLSEMKGCFGEMLPNPAWQLTICCFWLTGNTLFQWKW